METFIGDGIRPGNSAITTFNCVGLNTLPCWTQGSSLCCLLVASLLENIFLHIRKLRANNEPCSPICWVVEDQLKYLHGSLFQTHDARLEIERSWYFRWLSYVQWLWQGPELILRCIWEDEIQLVAPTMHRLLPSTIAAVRGWFPKSISHESCRTHRPKRLIFICVLPGLGGGIIYPRFENLGRFACSTDRCTEQVDSQCSRTGDL